MEPGELWGEVNAGLRIVELELLIFCSFWFILAAIDDLAVDLIWILQRLKRGRTPTIDSAAARAELRGPAAVFIAAWQERNVIGHTVRHLLAAWPQRDFILYVGCYRNDPDTIVSAMGAARNDPRVRIVVNGSAGPTTKADCLNRLFAAMEGGELRQGRSYRSIVIHDAEDMVHPAELAVIDRALSDMDFVQLPVRAELQPGSRFVGGHYADEFAEAHAKTLVVRDALGAAIPAAGVGCGFSRAFLARIADSRRIQGSEGPFAAASLTEDYELGLLAGRMGARSGFVRLRDHQGQLVATRAYFPGRLKDSVRQKARWIHGIAFQSWERLGWDRRPVELWMAARDRRGPLSSLVLLCAYALLVVEALLLPEVLAGQPHAVPVPPVLPPMILMCLAAFVWRAIWRFAFTAREYGLAEGLLAIIRLPVSNVIAILSGHRAIMAYVRTLRGAPVTWDKTGHDIHPAAGNRAPMAGAGA